MTSQTDNQVKPEVRTESDSDGSLNGVVSPPTPLDKTVKTIHWWESMDAIVRGHNSTGDLREQVFANYQRKEFKEARARLIILQHECSKMSLALETLERLEVEG